MNKIIVLLSALLAACATPDQKRFEYSVERIDQYLQDGVENGFSGALLIAMDGEILLNRGYGLANKSREISVSPNTVFTVGSVTKQFTAAAILKLSEQGKLRVDDQIDRFFETLPEDKKTITIHQLLTHTAGLRHSIGSDFDQTDPDVFFTQVFKSELLFEPGERHAYSNLGYSLLARIIEVTSRQPYEAYLSNVLFQPANMHQTGYLLPDWLEESLAHGYQRNVIDRGTLIERYRSDQQVSWHLKGNGGIHSTQNDMYRWYQALRTNAILSEELTSSFTKPYVLEQENGVSYYAYGWAIFSSDRQTKVISHNGGNGVFFHDYLWLPEEDAVIIFSTNASSRKVEVAWTIERMLFDTLYQPTPIIRNIYDFVVRYAHENSPDDAGALRGILAETYAEEIANASTLNRLGYILLDQPEQAEWAVALFEMNSTLFAGDANVWDSLGDGYVAIGQVENAIDCFRKATKLGSDSSAPKLRELLKGSS